MGSREKIVPRGKSKTDPGGNFFFFLRTDLPGGEIKELMLAGRKGGGGGNQSNLRYTNIPGAGALLALGSDICRPPSGGSRLFGPLPFGRHVYPPRHANRLKQRIRCVRFFDAVLARDQREIGVAEEKEGRKVGAGTSE